MLNIYALSYFSKEKYCISFDLNYIFCNELKSPVDLTWDRKQG